MSSIKARLGKFDTIDEFVEGYGQYFFRGGILLPTRRAKEEGERVALHIQIASGESVLRGEGIVQQVRTNAQGATVGMVIRFTRLDRSSKELVDRIMDHRREKRTRDVPAVTPPPAPSAPAQSDEGAELAGETFGAIADAIETSIDSIFSGAIQTDASGEASENEYAASLGDLAATAREVNPEESSIEPARVEAAPSQAEDAGDTESAGSPVEESATSEAAVQEEDAAEPEAPAEPEAALEELPPSSATTQETAIQPDEDEDADEDGESETSAPVIKDQEVSVAAEALSGPEAQSIDEPPADASTPEAGDSGDGSDVADDASGSDGAEEVRLDWIGDDHEELPDEVTTPRAEESAPRAQVIGPDHLAGATLFGSDASDSGASRATPTPPTPVVEEQDEAPAKTVMGMPAVQLDALERANEAPPAPKPVDKPRPSDTPVGGAREASTPPGGGATLAKITLERAVVAPDAPAPPVQAEDEEPQEAVHQFIKALTQKTQAIGADPRRASASPSATAGGSVPEPPPTQGADPAPAAFGPPPTKKDDTRSAFEASMDRAAASAEEGEAALDVLVSDASREAPLPAPMTGALQAIPSSKSDDQGLIARLVDWLKGLFDR